MPRAYSIRARFEGAARLSDDALQVASAYVQVQQFFGTRAGAVLRAKTMPIPTAPSCAAAWEGVRFVGWDVSRT